jgi:predicted DNA-binding protein (MmcQ/YjbR family)
VYKVMGKMFALVSQLNAEPSVTLKVLPANGEVLVDQFSAIIPGYHMNKRHWITVTLDRDVPSGMLQDLADQSYALVVSKLTRKQQLALQQLAHVEE